MTKSARSLLATATAVLAQPIDYDTLLSKLGAKDRLNVERHVAASELEPGPAHVAVWKRTACALTTLSPHVIQTTGQQAVQFYIADGKYRMQVFAMEDQRNGKLLVYLPDVLADAVKAGVISMPPKGSVPIGDTLIQSYPIKAEPREALTIESLTATNTPNAPNFFKHMLGWNRKALRITLLSTSTAAQMTASEALCALAAAQWAKGEPKKLD